MPKPVLRLCWLVMPFSENPDRRNALKIIGGNGAQGRIRTTDTRIFSQRPNNGTRSKGYCCRPSSVIRAGEHVALRASDREIIPPFGSVVRGPANGTKIIPHPASIRDRHE